MMSRSTWPGGLPGEPAPQHKAPSDEGRSIHDDDGRQPQPEESDILLTDAPLPPPGPPPVRRGVLWAETPLRELYERWYIPAKSPATGASTLAAWRSAIGCFGRVMGRTPRVRHLNSANLSGFVQRAERFGYAEVTARVCRKRMRVLWGFAADLGAAPSPPERTPLFKPEAVWRPDLAGKSQTLMEFLHTVYFPERDLRKDSRDQLIYTVNQFSAWAGRDATLLDLNREAVNAFVTALVERRSRRTARDKRGNLLGIWMHAYDASLVSQPPRRIRPVKIAKKLPTAWTPDELRRILAAAQWLPGSYWRLPRGDYMAAVIYVTYDTALRRADVFSLRRDQIGEDGTITHEQSKTSVDHVVRLRPNTLAAVDALFPPERDVIFPGPEPKTLRSWWREIMVLARIPRARWGAFQQLRRTSATHLEMVHPGSAPAHLGHLTPGMAAMHYIDPRICRPPRPLPPDPFGEA